MITEASITSIAPERDPVFDVRLYDVAAVFFLSMVTGVFGVAAGAEIGGTESYAETIGSLVGLWCGLIPGTYLVCRARGSGNVVADLGIKFKPKDLWAAFAGLGCQFLVLPILYLVVEQLASRDLTKDLEEPAKNLTDNAHGPGFWMLAVFLIVGAPLVEEIFYRGLLLRSLKRSMPAWPAVISCGLIFGAAHFNFITLPGLAVFGVVLGYLVHRAERLGPAIVAHAAFNGATVIALWLQ